MVFSFQNYTTDRKLVVELQRQCRELNIAEEVMQTEIVNRTIGDVNVRLITECEGEPGGPGDYRQSHYCVRHCARLVK